jgi:hypothetical protein
MISSVLQQPKVRALIRRAGLTGNLRAPDRIISMLKDSGFRTRWVDQSHISARRLSERQGHATR